MVKVEVKYTIPSRPGQSDGTQVDVIFSCDPVANPDGSFTVWDASGTYTVLDANQDVFATTTIESVGPVGNFGDNDNKLFIVADPALTPIVTDKGVAFVTNSFGEIGFYDVGAAVPPVYGERGRAIGGASSITETLVVP